MPIQARMTIKISPSQFQLSHFSQWIWRISLFRAVTGNLTGHTNAINSIYQSPFREASSRSVGQETHRLFIEPEGSLPRSQQPATCPYPEPHDSSSHP